jgi:hypothetical protein
MIRHKCCICANTLDINAIFTHDIILPTYQGVTVKVPVIDEVEKLEWIQCFVCYTVQLRRLIDEKIVYQDGHATGLGSSWLGHHREFLLFINKWNDDNILEVGGGNCILSNNYVGSSKKTWTIVDPNLTGIPNNFVKYYKGILNKDNVHLFHSNTIVISHTLEHFYNPKEIIDSFNELGIDNIFLSFPNMEKWIAKNLYGVLNFEHTFLINYENLIIFFNNCGYQLIDKLNYEDNESDFFYFKKIQINDKYILNYTEFNGISYINIFYNNMLKRIDELNLFIENFTTNDHVYLMPASVYSQYLVCNGLKDINCLIDNSTKKHNCRLYGTMYNVKNSDELLLLNDKKILLIINAGFHNDEIITQFSQNKNIKLLIV